VVADEGSKRLLRRSSWERQRREDPRSSRRRVQVSRRSSRRRSTIRPRQAQGRQLIARLEAVAGKRRCRRRSRFQRCVEGASECEKRPRCTCTPGQAESTSASSPGFSWPEPPRIPLQSRPSRGGSRRKKQHSMTEAAQHARTAPAHAAWSRACAPRGRLHLGHYQGAVEELDRDQPQGRVLLLLRGLGTRSPASTRTPPTSPRPSARCSPTWIAAGLDPERCTLFIQSRVKQARGALSCSWE